MKEREIFSTIMTSKLNTSVTNITNIMLIISEVGMDEKERDILNNYDLKYEYNYYQSAKMRISSTIMTSNMNISVTNIMLIISNGWDG